MSHQSAFDKLSAALRQALKVPTSEECRALISEAITRTDRGPEYFRQIAPMRKTQTGGRPRKTSNDSGNH